MKLLKTCAAAAAMSAASLAGAHANPYVEEAPTGFFVPGTASPFDTPYYRGFGEDWSWQHDPITETFTSAVLNISAWDVDEEFGEVDEIWAKDDGVWTLLGTLVGENNEFSFTEFNLPSNFWDDMATGLEVEIRIDVTNDLWFVSLAKSVITLDGVQPPDPNPVVPVPGAVWLMAAGFAPALVRRFRKQA